ncbi:MAG: IS30 family transposase [Alphaproteobacteria bacterium]|nr:IS30 family transposase [Alphaproteobacteria bacterium]
MLPKQARRSLTQDNGTEFSLHHKLQQIGMQTYFCNPHSPWQKGGIENMNSHLRRYLPLRTDISTLSNEQVALLAHRINHIPRKCLDYKTPAEVFYNHLLHFKCESTKTVEQAWRLRSPHNPFPPRVKPCMLASFVRVLPDRFGNPATPEIVE